VKISHKLILGYILLALLISVVGYSAVRVSRKALQDSIGSSAANAASEILDEIDKAIHSRAQEWRVYSHSPLVQETLAASNRWYKSLDDVEAHMDRADQAWSAAGPGELAPWMKQLLENQVARDLRSKVDTLELLSGYKVYGEVFLTNRYGANVAQTGRTSDLRQDDEAWWQRARSEGLYIADVQYDDSAHVFSTDICVRVEDDAGQFLGVIKAVLNIQEIIQIVEDRAHHLHRGATQHLTLLTNDRKLIHPTDENLRPFAEDAELLDGLSSSRWGVLKAGRRGEGTSQDVLAAYSISRGYADFEGFGWILLTEYWAHEVLAPVYALRKKIVIMSLIVNAIGVLLGLGLANSLGRRIRALRRATLDVGRGNLDARVDVSSRDEIGQLGTCFNSMAQDLKEARKQAEAADRAKSRFLSHMSHEIRTPMTVLLGAAEMLLDDDLPEQERAELLGAVGQTGRQLLALIDEILDLSKIEAGKLRIKRTWTSPFQIVEDVVGPLRHQAASKELQLDAEFDGPIPERIETDPIRLRQIVVNLVGNAIKFTERGGIRVIVRLSRKEHDADYLQIEVTDTGMGISQTQLDRLFHPFVQADLSTTRRFGGTGLGLAISKQLTELLGGDITVTSDEGIGSTFRVTVPTGCLDGVPLVLCPEDAVEPFLQEESPSTNKRQLSGRVLLVEDDPLIQRLLLTILTKAGADVSVADNGQEAVEAVLAARGSGTPFDMVLMDLLMPVMDGFEATSRLRDRGYTGPIIALTADGMQETRDRCMEAGCDSHLTKPIQADRLVKELRAYLAT
jgi:signal transduction histidine kinase/ActR/RegA family two-component response regulator